MKPFFLLVGVLSVVLFAGEVQSAHQRGGTINYKPNATSPYLVDFTVRLSFRRSVVYCDESRVASRYPSYSISRTVTRYNGSSNWGSTSERVSLYCSDFNIQEDWSEVYGNFSIFGVYGDDWWNVRMSDGDWIAGITHSNPYNNPVMQLKARVNRTVNGVFNNSSPVTSLPLTVYVIQGIPSIIRIPVEDPDGDIVRCRNASYQECYREMCTYFPHGVLDEGNCTLSYNGGGYVNQLLPIILKLEDFPSGTMQFDSSNSLGSVDLQFVVHINLTGTQPPTQPPTQPSIRDMNTDFNNWGAWRQATNDQFDWTLHSGCTSSSITGPCTDHTGSGKYAYIETSSPRALGDTARLIFNGNYDGDLCMTFYSHMYGSSIGSLKVYDNGVVVLSKAGDHGNQWMKEEVDLGSNRNVVIEGVRGSSYKGDIAIDDISVTKVRCASTECRNYTVLNTTDRAASYRGITNKCDRDDITPGWYRFMGDAGTTIATSCVDMYHCGTYSPGWMNGSHPTQAEGIVNRTVCYHRNSNCCYRNNDIRVRNCGGFYVYELVQPSTCNYRYCGSRNSTNNTCASSPCRNKGTCATTYYGYRCYCPYGYSGTQCETNMFPCNSRPCRNGGTCHNYYWLNRGYHCSCPRGYTGQQCQTYMPCTSNPCRNGGTCQGGVGWYRCSCPYGYTGQQCQTYMYPCNSRPCRNGGTCHNNYWYNGGYYCSCPRGYTGQQCQTYMPCTSDPCRNGGTCQGGVGWYRCSCPYRYTGQQCQTNMACTSDPCRNGGTCRNGYYGGYYCSCPSGYTGQQCQTNMPCNSDPCRNGGTCRNDYYWYNGGYYCSCPSGYTGQQCQTSLKTSVTCGENFMQIDLRDQYFPGLNWRSLHLKNTSCTATKTAYTMRLRAPLDGCGVTYVEHDKKITFWNEVRNEQSLWPSWGGNLSAITRGENLLIPFYCEYGREKIVSTSFSPSRKLVYASEGSYGNFTFTMDLYQTSRYSTPYSPFAYPVVVYPNQPLWVKYQVKNTNADLVVFAENCRATTSTNPDSFPQHVFLERGCTRDPTMVYWYNPYSNAQRFSIRSFSFVYSNTFLVYLHCELIVCHRNSTNSRCAQGCISSRKRREAVDGSNKHDLSVGPLKGPNAQTGTDEQGGEETSSANTATIGSVSTVGAVALLVAILLSVKMFHNRRNRVPPRETPPPAIVMNQTVNSYEQHVMEDGERTEIEI